jgi:hypothetical protein
MSFYADPRSIEVSDEGSSPKRVSKLLWCRNCRDGRHNSCSGVRREARKGKYPCECPKCKEKR